MSFTFEQLKHMTVAELREIAAGLKHEAVQGYTQLNKEHLLAALCKALNIDMYVHHVAKPTALDKSRIKQKIKDLKKSRAVAVEAHDSGRLHTIRHEIHELKRSLRKAADAAPGK
jgi:DNA-binding transcriptional MerR regulator